MYKSKYLREYSVFHSSKDDGKIIQILRCLRTWNIGGEEEKKTARILSRNVCTPIFFIQGVPKLTQDLNLPRFLHQVIGKSGKRTV